VTSGKNFFILVPATLLGLTAETIFLIWRAYNIRTLQVQRNLLDNPFKNEIEKDSPLLMQPPRPGTSGKQNVPQQRVSRIQIIGIIGGSSVLLLSVICCYGRRTQWKLCKECRKYAEDVYQVARHPLAAMHVSRRSAFERMPKRSRTNEQRLTDEWRQTFPSPPMSARDDVWDTNSASTTPRTMVADDASDATTKLIDAYPV
jgi:hypothetical protein